MKKIVIVSRSDPRIVKEPGGVNTHMEILFQIMERIQFEYEVITVKTLADLWKLRSKTVRRADAVYLNASIYDSAMIKLILQIFMLRSNRVIIQFHGGRFSALRFRKLYSFLLKIAVHKIERFSVLNDEQLQEFGQVFGDADKCIKIPNFIDVPQTPGPKRKEAPAGPIRFLFMGRVVKEKGIMDAIEAVRKLDPRYEIELRIAGSGPGLETARLLAGCDPRIRFLGPLFGEEKEAALKGHDVFLLPTSYPEGFPYSILEAMTHRMPVIATANGAIPDMVIDRDNGFLVEPHRPDQIAGKMMEFIGQPDLIPLMGLRSYEIVKSNFSLEEGAACYRHLLSSERNRLVETQLHPAKGYLTGKGDFE